MSKPTVNPYAAPETVSDAPEAMSPSSGHTTWVLAAIVLTLIRGFGVGFATMVGWVHVSGVVIHWHNATPILVVIFALCSFAHWLERWSGERRKALTQLAFVAYVAGIVVSTLFGLAGSFPMPF